jgi:beta-glucanase (GH16 family)
MASSPSYINARGVALSTASQHSFWAANPGQITSAPGGGHVLYGDGFDDIFYIYSPTDQVILPQQAGIDTVNDDAWDAAYTLPAGVQNLILSGGGQVATGNALDNLIIAQSGTTTMSGGGGDDIFVDGSGPDTIIDPQGSGDDVIYNFKNGVDHVSLVECSGLTSFAAVQAAMTQVGADVVLNMGDGQTLTFRNETISHFGANDFYLPLNTSGMKLSFDDEFNSFSASANGVGTTWMTAMSYGERTLPANSEAEYYSDSSVGVNPFAINNGVLDITAAPTNPSSNPLGLPYTSGVITTYKSFSQLYGYFEMRAEMPAGAGFWPAFWLLPENNAWPPELDVTEQIGSMPGIDYVTAHTNVGKFNNMISSGVDVGNTTQGFHTYGVNWTPTTITWYFDGQAIATCATPADMHSPMYMIVNLAVGAKGSWPGPANAGSKAVMQIDYVRAYAYDSGNPSSSGSQTSAAAASKQSTAKLASGPVQVSNATTHTLTTGSVATAEQDATERGHAIALGQAADAGYAASGLAAGSTVEITTGGRVTLNAAVGGSSATNMLTVKFSRTGTLTLNARPFIAAIGATPGDTLIAGASFQTLTGAGDDKLVGSVDGHDLFRDTAAGLNGDTISGFMATDVIDLTNLAFDRSHLTYSAATSVLSITDGHQASAIKLVGAFDAAGFTAASDGHGGTMITY